MISEILNLGKEKPPTANDDNNPDSHILANHLILPLRWVIQLVSARVLGMLDLQHEIGQLTNRLSYAFSRDFKKKGMIKLSTYLRQYK
jgi:hypothetical protein